MRCVCVIAKSILHIQFHSVSIKRKHILQLAHAIVDTHGISISLGIEPMMKRPDRVLVFEPIFQSSPF